MGFPKRTTPGYELPVSGPDLFKIGRDWQRLTVESQAKWGERAKSAGLRSGRPTSAQAEYMADRIRRAVRRGARATVSTGGA